MVKKRVGLLLLGLGSIALVILIILFRPGGASLSQEGATILVLGLDEVEGRSRSDTIILAHIKGQEVS